MSSIKLDSLISEFPEETEAVQRLVRFIEANPSEDRPPREVTAQRLFDQARPSSQRALAMILARLVQSGVLERIFRVESEALGGIGDFESIDKIPPVMFDSRTGRDIEVKLDQVRMIYKLPR